MIQEGLRLLETPTADFPKDATLMQFPTLFNPILELGRSEDWERIQSEARPALLSMLQEIRRSTLSIGAS